MDDGRVLDPRSGGLVLAATGVLTFFAGLAPFVALVLATGIACDYGCDDPGAWASYAVLAAPGAVVLGGVLTWVTARWAWLLLGTAVAIATAAAILS
jgi:hypothetical protein